MVTFDANLKNQAFTQYSGFAFNSMVKFNGKFLGANATGLSLIEGKVDNMTPIAAEMELPTTDLGIQQNKKLRFIYPGYETDGSISVEVIFDQKDSEGVVYPIEPLKTGQQRGRCSISRLQQGRYVTLTIRNVAGADFSIDEISALPVILHSGRQS